MKYQQGKINRVFLVKFEHEDDLLEELKSLVKKEEVRVGVILFLGALEKAEVVTGPRRIEVPPEPVWAGFEDGREILGIGTILWQGSEPNVHLHAGLGRQEQFLLGCLRKGARVYLVVEAIILEISGIAAVRKYVEAYGLNMIEIEDKTED